MSETTLDRLVDCKSIQTELGVKEATALRIMGNCKKVRVGRRVFVYAREVDAFLASRASS